MIRSTSEPKLSEDNFYTHHAQDRIDNNSHDDANFSVISTGKQNSPYHENISPIFDSRLTPVPRQQQQQQPTESDNALLWTSNEKLPLLTPYEIEEACMRPWLSLVALDSRVQHLYLAENFLANISFDGSHTDTIYNTFFNFNPNNVVYRANSYAVRAARKQQASSAAVAHGLKLGRSLSVSHSQDAALQIQAAIFEEEKLLNHEGLPLDTTASCMALIATSADKQQRNAPGGGGFGGSSLKRRRETFNKKFSTLHAVAGDSDNDVLVENIENIDAQAQQQQQEVRFTSSVEHREHEKQRLHFSPEAAAAAGLVYDDADNPDDNYKDALSPYADHYTCQNSVESQHSSGSRPPAAMRGRLQSIKFGTLDGVPGVLGKPLDNDAPTESTVTHRAAVPTTNIYSFENYIDPKLLENVIERERSKTTTRQRIHYTVDGVTVIRSSCITRRELQQQPADIDPHQHQHLHAYSRKTKHLLPTYTNNNSSEDTAAAVTIENNEAAEVQRRLRTRHISGGTHTTGSTTNSIDELSSSYHSQITYSRQQSSSELHAAATEKITNNESRRRISRHHGRDDDAEQQHQHVDDADYHYSYADNHQQRHQHHRRRHNSRTPSPLGGGGGGGGGDGGGAGSGAGGDGGSESDGDGITETGALQRLIGLRVAAVAASDAGGNDRRGGGKSTPDDGASDDAGGGRIPTGEDENVNGAEISSGGMGGDVGDGTHAGKLLSADADLSYMSLLKPIQWTFQKPPELSWDEIRKLITLGDVIPTRIMPLTSLSISAAAMLPGELSYHMCVGIGDDAAFDEGLSTPTSDSMLDASGAASRASLLELAVISGAGGNSLLSPGDSNVAGDGICSARSPTPQAFGGGGVGTAAAAGTGGRRSIRRRERRHTTVSNASSSRGGAGITGISGAVQTNNAAGGGGGGSTSDLIDEYTVEEHSDSYDARLVDDRNIFLAAVRVNSTALESIKSSIVSSHLFLSESALKQRINAEFADRFPHVRITYSKMLSLKRQIRKVCCHFPDSLDVPTAALAHFLFEKLTLRGFTRKDTRKVLASVCILLAAKLHDTTRSDLLKLQERLEHEFRLSRRVILSYEFATLVALDFDVHVPCEQLEITLRRIGNEDLLAKGKWTGGAPAVHSSTTMTTSGGGGGGGDNSKRSSNRRTAKQAADEQRRRGGPRRSHGLKIKDSLRNLLVRRTLYDKPR